jgi:hypothetical protein
MAYQTEALGSETETWDGIGRPNQPEKCDCMFLPIHGRKLNGPWMYVSLCMSRSHQQNGINCCLAARDSYVFDGRIR